MSITFTVPGVPVGKGRPRFAKRGQFVKTYTPEKTASYENLVKMAAAEAMHSTLPMEGAVSLNLLLYITPPVSWSEKKKKAALSAEIWPTSKPDIDNVLKGIADACNGIVWLDDKQIVDCQISKKYAERAEAVVIVELVQAQKTLRNNPKRKQ